MLAVCLALPKTLFTSPTSCTLGRRLREASIFLHGFVIGYQVGQSLVGQASFFCWICFQFIGTLGICFMWTSVWNLVGGSRLYVMNWFFWRQQSVVSFTKLGKSLSATIMSLMYSHPCWLQKGPLFLSIFSFDDKCFLLYSFNDFKNGLPSVL